MRLTLHFDYAMRTLLFLAAHPGECVKTREISAAYGISKHHLVRVIQGLEKAGYVRLSHGRNGGVELAREPESIRLGEVLRVMEPNMTLVECFNPSTNTCPILPVCKLKMALNVAGQKFIAALDESTLADVAPTRQALDRHVLAKTAG
jgi:Rrf2 family nitric oxide-sensitive transcriptional repressor